MNEFLKSGTFRRMVATGVGLLVILLNKKLGLGLDAADQAAIVGLIVAYVAGSNFKEAKIESAPVVDLEAAAAELAKKG